jgi:hypothetical protein
MKIVASILAASLLLANRFVDIDFVRRFYQNLCWIDKSMQSSGDKFFVVAHLILERTL